jgi:CheY-like chemotaxis protein
LQAAGYIVDSETFTGASLKKLRDDPPDAVVVDLSRLPMQGRDVGIAVRMYRTTRHVPVVFVEGEAEKVARVKQQLPDAVFTSWSGIRGSLARAIANPPADPIVPGSLMAGYSGTPLVQKLGIKENFLVALVGAPPGFEKKLGVLPKNVTLRRRAGGSDLTVWFTKKRQEVESRIRRLGEGSGSGGLWVAWPKKSSGIPTDLTQVVVRKMGLASGLVDYKIAAIDDEWTGLRFAVRTPRPSGK